MSGSYTFGTFRLDLARRVFTRDAQVLSLAPKTFDLLALLVRNPGRALSKRELMSALWPDTFVEEANLSFQISLLRKALGDDGARWIETVPKHGYRFTADVRADRDEAPSTPPGRNGPALAADTARARRDDALGRRWAGGCDLAGRPGVCRRLMAIAVRAGREGASARGPPHGVSGTGACAQPLAGRQPGGVRLEWPGPGQRRHLRQAGRPRRALAPDHASRVGRHAGVVTGRPDGLRS